MFLGLAAQLLIRAVYTAQRHRPQLINRSKLVFDDAALAENVLQCNSRSETAGFVEFHLLKLVIDAGNLLVVARLFAV
ncbi:hypothetical protein D3C81_2004690 [compost metagenome]